MLKIRFMNISKQDLGKTLKRYKGTAWDQSPLFKKVYEAEYGQFGGEPFGCLVGDYYFDQTPPDVELLGEMAKVAAAAHTPFIAGASPTVMQMASLAGAGQSARPDQDLHDAGVRRRGGRCANRRTRAISAWRCRAILSRLPYGAKTNPVEEFDFEEDTGAADHSRYTWANAAYAMAVNINRSFKLYGWCSRIRGVESGGAVEGLPVHTFPTDDGGVDMKCPTEIAISDRREAELAKNGFMPLVHRKNSDFAAFIGAQSLQKPFEYDDPDATANANLCGAAAVSVCMLPVRPLPEVHRPRQDRLVQGARGHAGLAAEVDHELRRRRSGAFVGNDQGAEAAGRRRSAGRGSRREPGLLLGEVLPASALSARRADRVAAAGLQAAVGEGRLERRDVFDFVQMIVQSGREER